MKQKYLCLLTLFLMSACSNQGLSEPKEEISHAITLEEEKCSYSLNTKEQLDYLNTTNPSVLSDEIKGSKELSHPQPVSLKWTCSKPTSLYRVILSENEDYSSPVVYKTEKDSLEIYNLKVNTKYYVEIRNFENDVSLKTSFTTVGKVRNLYIDGVTNVRDLGGKEGENKKKIKQGLLFRGGRLNNSYPEGSGKNGTDYSKKDTTAYCYEREITDAGIQEFKKLGIINEIDLRKEDGNGFPGDAETEKTFDNIQGVTYNAMPMGKSDPLADSTNKKALVNIFEFLKEEKNYPLYFHCNIGTNRTGTVAMLLEGLCGVSEEEMLKDYMFSNFGTICASYRQYDEEEEPRAETSDVTVTNEVYDRIVNGIGDTISEKTISVLKQAGVSEETALKVKNILLG